MKKDKIFLILIILLKSQLLLAQEIVQQKTEVDNSSIISETGTLNYLNPITQYINHPDSFLQNLGVYNQAFTFAGNYKYTLDNIQFRENNYPIDSLKPYLKTNTLDKIIELANNTSIVVINEQHDWPLDRGFTNVLIAELKKIGYNVLALETFNEKVESVSFPNSEIGYFTNEPLMGELVRNAITLGYHLISYDDNFIPEHLDLFKEQTNYRDSVAAEVLYEKVKNIEQPKIIILCGYSHNAELPIKFDYTYFPLAYMVKNIFNIDPLTIDQVYFSEINPSNWHQKISENTPIDKTMYVEKGIISFDCDIYLIHPKTNFVNHKPDWGKKYFNKRLYPFENNNKNVKLIQAYYYNETQNEKIDKLIPADQYYIQDENQNEVYLSLKLNNKYKIVYRDLDNKILQEDVVIIESKY